MRLLSVLDRTRPNWKTAISDLIYLYISPYQSAEELAKLGLDRLKSALMALGLKCGGTIEARSERLFSTKGKTLGELHNLNFESRCY